MFVLYWIFLKKYKKSGPKYKETLPYINFRRSSYCNETLMVSINLMSQFIVSRRISYINAYCIFQTYKFWSFLVKQDLRGKWESQLQIDFRNCFSIIFIRILIRIWSFKVEHSKKGKQLEWQLESELNWC